MKRWKDFWAGLFGRKYAGGGFVRLRALVCLSLALALACTGALASAWYEATIPVYYCGEEGIFADTTVTVSTTDPVVFADPSFVPAGYEPLNTTPVTVAFDANGRPNPGFIVFQYQKAVEDSSYDIAPVTPSVDQTASGGVQSATIPVFYSAENGVFAETTVTINQYLNTVYPDASLVPSGYVALDAEPVTVMFDAFGNPNPDFVNFQYQKAGSGNASQDIAPGGADTPDLWSVTVDVPVYYMVGIRVFAETTVTVSPYANVIAPDQSLVPSGYTAVDAAPVVVTFDENGNTDTAYVIFQYQEGQTSGGSSITAGWQVPGQIVTFGAYEQDGNADNGKEPVEWIVLRTEQGRALLLSRYALHSRSFHSEWQKISWKDCSLRSWLNGTFYNSCFSSTQRAAILETSLTSNYVDVGVSTQDKVFLLSASEAKSLSRELLLCQPSRYARNKSVATENGYCYWWLRDTTNRKNDANRVLPSGDVYEYGGNTNATGVGVRPAIWVDVQSAFGW